MALVADERHREPEPETRGGGYLAEKERSQNAGGKGSEIHQLPVGDDPSHRLMEGGQPPLPREGFPCNHDDLIGRHIIRTFLHAAPAEKALGHTQVRLVVQGDIPLQQVLRQGNLPPSHRRLPLEGAESGTVGAAGAALHALLQFLFNPFECFGMLDFLLHG